MHLRTILSIFAAVFISLAVSAQTWNFHPVITPLQNAPVAVNVVATNTALAAACTVAAGCPVGDSVFTQGVWRSDYGPKYGAPPLFFLPQVGSCTANSMVNDGGSCVNSAEGNSWKAQITEIDPREFGAAPKALVPDSAPAINAAATFANTFNVSTVAGGTVRIHTPGNFNICGTITWLPGVSFWLDPDVEILTCGQATAVGAQDAAFTANVVGTNILNVTSVASGTIKAGDWISGPSIPTGDYIEATSSTPGTPCGGSACTGAGTTGTYNLSAAASGTVTGGSYTTNAPALGAMVTIPAGANNRVKERKWIGGKLLGNLNATHIFDLQDFERVDISGTFEADVNGAYVEVGNSGQSSSSFELNFFDNRINRLSATHAPIGNYGIESLNGGANHEIHDNRFIGVNIGVYGQLADWYIQHNHIWTDPAGSRGDLVNCIKLTNYGANIEGNQCDLGTVGVDESATLFPWNISPSSTGYVTNMSMNRANTQYGTDQATGSATVTLGANAIVNSYGNTTEGNLSNRYQYDYAGTLTKLNTYGSPNQGQAFSRAKQDLSETTDALFVGGPRTAIGALGGNNGMVMDFGGIEGANKGAIYAFDYSSSTGRAFSINNSGGSMILKGTNGGASASYVCVDATNNITIQTSVCH